jgi:hypothetical protein
MKLVRVEIRPGVYVKVPEDQAEQADAKKRPAAANKARRAPKSPQAGSKAEA